MQFVMHTMQRLTEYVHYNMFCNASITHSSAHPRHMHDLRSDAVDVGAAMGLGQGLPLAPQQLYADKAYLLYYVAHARFQIPARLWCHSSFGGRSRRNGRVSCPLNVFCINRSRVSFQLQSVLISDIAIESLHFCSHCARLPQIFSCGGLLPI